MEKCVRKLRRVNKSPEIIYTFGNAVIAAARVEVGYRYIQMTYGKYRNLYKCRIYSPTFINKDSLEKHQKALLLLGVSDICLLVCRFARMRSTLDTLFCMSNSTFLLSKNLLK